MIITKTPFRMSFFGGGTDVPSFFEKGKGSVISTTFDKYVYVTVRHLPRFFEYSTEVEYSIQERVTNIDDIKHPMVRNAMKYLDMHELHISYDADLPSRTGLGTSSSFAVGLLNAFYCLKGKYACKKQLANDAIHVERDMCNEAGGWQDQIAASFGGLNRIDFFPGGDHVNPIIISPKRKEELNENLVLFFTGFSRNSFEIQRELTNNIKSKTDTFDEMLRILDDAQDVLENQSRNLDDFGILLNKNWELKKKTNSLASNAEIDELYQKALAAGATGGKLLGAGGGGFLLFYVPKDRQDHVKKALNLLEVPFKFEKSGTRVIYYTPEEFSLESVANKEF